VSFVVVAVAVAVITFVVAAVVTKIVAVAALEGVVVVVVGLRTDVDPVELSLLAEFGQNRLAALAPIELLQMDLLEPAQTGIAEFLKRTACPRWRAAPPG